MKKFKVGDWFSYIAGGAFTYHCKVLEINKYGNYCCKIIRVNNNNGKIVDMPNRTLLHRSFTDGTRTLVDTDYKEKPLTEKEEYEEIWV